MISFRQYLSEAAAGNYVSINVESPVEVSDLSKNFPYAKICSGKNQHVTLIYSVSTNLSTPKIKAILPDKTIAAVISAIDAFDSSAKDGKRDSETCAIVAKIDSKELVTIHEKLKELGLIHSYEEFSPHISLMYEVSMTDKTRAIDFVKSCIGTKVTLGGYIIQAIDTNWVSKL